jgi:hypothetical protein
MIEMVKAIDQTRKHIRKLQSHISCPQRHTKYAAENRARAASDFHSSDFESDLQVPQIFPKE